MTDDQTAKAIFDEWNKAYLLVTSMRSAENLIDRIAAAIAAQRERDAKVAVNEIMGRAKAFNDKPYRVLADAVDSAIRRGEP